jgi:hypothetical protein
MGTLLKSKNAMSTEADDKFTITHRIVQGRHTLTFSPTIPNEGYPPKAIFVDEDQWNALKYHFATEVDKGNSKLVYIL